MSGSAGKRSSVGTDVSLAKRRTSNFSDIPASDVVSHFGKEKLIGKCKILIHGNVARLPLLEARNLINSACRNSIEAKLNLGQSLLAATELVEYFEVNHDGVKIREFSAFVQDQAGKSSTQLLKFAKELEDCIIQLALASHGSSEHTDESGPSPSILATNEAKVKAAPHPFLPPQFPPTGSPAAQGPPSQPLLGPPLGMPLSMAPKVPEAFPPGMDVPPGFGSQPMSVSQPLWGIPPTSTVSLAPSVSTEQANPSPFLPHQFPPTGSPAAQGPPSQPLLGPPPGMPLSMAPQIPGTFPPGMGVPPGFLSQPMSVSQPFWGIPPTSTVSLAPSVSTEQGPLDSPHIHRLRDHLYKRYKRFKVGEGGKKMEFVRLAVLLGEPNVRNDEKVIHDKLAFLRKFRNCGKEERQIAGYIDAFDLLHKSSDSIRVVYGQPGIGKTTLLTHVCRALAMKEADSEYALVLYFPLRNKKVSGAKTLSELFSYCTSDDKKLDLSEVEQSLVDSEEKQMLIMLDGADEVQELLSVPDSSVIQEILAGNTLPQADVIVSSRPGSLPFLQRHSSSLLEIHGFDQASIERYIKHFFNNTPEKAKKMMKELHSRPDLLGGAHIPMNLFIYCSVYDYGELPPTMTECHKKFLCNVVKREHEKYGVPCQVDPSLSRLSPEVKGLFKSLGALAYEGMMKNPPVFVFDESDIRRAFPTLPPEAAVEESIFKGLLVQHSCRVGYEEVNTFNFSHTTNHEFFVAWYISHLPEADQVQFVKEHFSDPKFAVVVRFYSGLTGLSTPGVAPLLCQSVSARSTSSISSPVTSFSLPSECSNRDPSLLYLFHSLYESQNSKFTQNIVQHLNQSLVFYLFLTSHDTLATAHCLGKCTHLKKLVFSRVKLPPSSLPHVCTILKANSHLLSLDLPVEHLSSTDATALVSGTAVEKLDLNVRETTLSALPAIFHSRTIKELILHISSLSKHLHSGKEKQDLSHSVSENTTLRKLVLDDSSDYKIAVLHGVAASATIEDLEVYDLPSPDGGEHDVAEALAKCVVNTKLRRVVMVGLPPLPVMKALTTRKVPLEELMIYSLGLWGGEDLKELERTAAKIRVVRKLVLLSPSDYKTAVLHGVAASATIEDLEVYGPDRGEHDVAEALAKCVVNTKLRRVKIQSLPPLPVMKGLTTREVPLEELVISPPWRRGTVFSEDHLKEMERSAARIRVRKVDYDVCWNPAMCDAVSSGLGENKYLQEVTLRDVPEEKKQFVRSKLSSVKTLTIN